MTVIDNPKPTSNAADHPTGIAAGWYPDPRLLHNLRYFDGASWTGHVTHSGPSPCPGCGQTDSTT